MTDADLITTWGLFTEAVVAVAGSLSDGLDQAGHLTLAEFDVLIRLHREPTHMLSMTHLAAEIGLSSGGFTKFIDRMEIDGLVFRQRAHADRSVVFAVLTKHGSELTAAALVRHTHDLRKHLLAPLGDHGLRDFAALARALRDSNRKPPARER